MIICTYQLFVVHVFAYLATETLYVFTAGRSDLVILKLSRHYEVIIIGTWYEFAHQSSPLSQHTLCESMCINCRSWECRHMHSNLIHDGIYPDLPMHSDNLAEQLWLAILYDGQLLTIKLLQGGAPPNSDYYTRQHGGVTPLHRACAHNNLRSAKIIIKFGAIVAAPSNIGWTPLHDACRFNREAIAKLLLKHQCPTGEPGC